MDTEAIRETVLRLVRKCKTRDPFRICEKLNIAVWSKPLPENVRGIYSKTLRRPYILINSIIDVHWQRFICAHELGHDRLKHSLNGFHVDRSDIVRNDKYEWQANLFAVFLLLDEQFGIHVANSAWFRDILHEATIYRDSRRLAHVICEAMEEYI